MVTALDDFIPHPEIRERHETIVEAPANLVLEVARGFDLQSIPVVHAIFWLRAKLLGARPARTARLDTEALRAMGWGVLKEIPGRLFVAGAVCQPWQPDVVFTPVPPEDFLSDASPDRVKIAWTLEAEALTEYRSRLATETRVVATDAQARVRFRRYWRLFGIGILAIRWFMVPAMRREAERRWRAHRIHPDAPAG